MINILLVEDNPVNQQVLSAMLKRAHYHVDTADNGLDAVNLIQKQSAYHYACILMDLQMPVMDGFTATRAIRNLGRNYDAIPIIAVTANMIHNIEDQIHTAGMRALLPKPVHYDDLMNAINREITTEFTL